MAHLFDFLTWIALLSSSNIPEIAQTVKGLLITIIVGQLILNFCYFSLKTKKEYDFEQL
jgi:hypothetical protein